MPTLWSLEVNKIINSSIFQETKATYTKLVSETGYII